MKVLAFDTALAACSAAAWSDGEILAARHQRLERGHAEALMPMVEAVRAEAGLAYHEFDLIAVTVGPGTFTGLRIGLAAARGLALASGVALVGLTTLEVVAWGIPEQVLGADPVLAVHDARRGEVYAQAFDPALEPLGAPALTTPRGARELIPGGPVLVVGTGAELILGPSHGAPPGFRLADAPALPDAVVVATLAARRGPEAAGAAPPAPLYLRPPDAKLPGAARGGRS